MIRTVLVEDQTILRESLVSVIEAQDDMEVIASLSNAADAFDVIRQHAADLVLMDVCTESNASGIVATRKIKASDMPVKVIVMTGLPEISFIEQARSAGADSFVYKNVGTKELLAVMRSTMKGYSMYPQLTQISLPSVEDLNETETSILRLVCKTKSRKEIAKELYLSESTVKRHISEILVKTGYDSILRLAVDAVAHGSIVPNIKSEE